MVVPINQAERQYTYDENCHCHTAIHITIVGIDLPL
jgi:hypothetical protein